VYLSIDIYDVTLSRYYLDIVQQGTMFPYISQAIYQ